MFPHGIDKFQENKNLIRQHTSPLAEFVINIVFRNVNTQLTYRETSKAIERLWRT